jgi:DNA-binding MarR family transcriptional regulator
MNTDQELAYSLRELIVMLYRQMQKQISNEEQLSVAAQNVMYQLTQKSALLPSQLCALLPISSQYLSQVLNQLERLDYITRTPAATDGRKILISLTEGGRRKVIESRVQREAWLTQRIENQFSASDKETVGQALVLFRRLLDSPDESNP